jgi:guanylate kinase
MRGPLVIVSGPSGTGKSTTIARLLAAPPVPLRLAVSATTRAPRAGECEGVHYWFWDRTHFEQAVAEGQFLEHAEVHGNLYGTPRDEVDPFRERGVGVVLDIDVQGADQVRAVAPDAVAVFLYLTDPAEYERRLRRRASESEEALQRRLANGRRELARMADYHYQVPNDDLDAAVARLSEVVRSHSGGEHAR